MHLASGELPAIPLEVILGHEIVDYVLASLHYPPCPHGIENLRDAP